MKRHLLWVLGCLCALAMCAIPPMNGVAHGEADSDAGSGLRIVGFSQMEMTNPWRIAETVSIQESAASRGIELVVRDANSDVQRQVQDCLELIELPVDVLILAPRLEEGYAPVFEAARQAGIPVILVDRETEGVPGTDFACCITADFEREGHACAQLLAEAFEGKPCRIIELTGTPGSSVAAARTKGFMEALADYPNMEVVLSASGDFVRTTAQETMERILQDDREAFQAIFAHDDDTGIGAIQALKKAGLMPGVDVQVVSIAGQKDALKAIIAGELLASVECDPRLGEYTFGVIDAMERGETWQERIIYTGMIYDLSNAEANYDRAF